MAAGQQIMMGQAIRIPASAIQADGTLQDQTHQVERLVSSIVQTFERYSSSKDGSMIASPHVRFRIEERRVVYDLLGTRRDSVEALRERVERFDLTMFRQHVAQAADMAIGAWLKREYGTEIYADASTVRRKA